MKRNAAPARLRETTLALAVAAAAAAPAALGAGGYTLTVNATVAPACRFTQAAGQVLTLTNTVGGIDPTLATNATGATTLTYKCTNGQAPSFTFAGANDSAGNHRVLNGANAMVYTTAFTGGGAGSGFGSGTDKTLILNGTITAAQFGAAAAGTYTDTLSVDILP